MKYATHSLKKSRKAKQIQTIVKNIPYIFRKKKTYTNSNKIQKILNKMSYMRSRIYKYENLTKQDKGQINAKV